MIVGPHGDHFERAVRRRWKRADGEAAIVLRQIPQIGCGSKVGGGTGFAAERQIEDGALIRERGRKISKGRICSARMPPPPVCATRMTVRCVPAGKAYATTAPLELRLRNGMGRYSERSINLASPLARSMLKISCRSLATAAMDGETATASMRPTGIEGSILPAPSIASESDGVSRITVRIRLSGRYRT